VEEIDATRIILSALPIKGVLLALLHGSYSERSSKADLMRSLSRGMLAASIMSGGRLSSQSMR
jgi:hypothetical protein